MGVAYSKEIDLSAALDGMQKLSKGADEVAQKIESKLSKALKSLDEKISDSLSNSSSGFANFINSVDNLGKRLKKVKVGNMGAELSKLGEMGDSSFSILEKGAKLFGHAIRWALGPLRLIFYVLEVISKVNPFGWIKTALGWATDLYQKLKDIASGANNEHREARKARTDVKSMRNINKVGEKGVGWTNQDIADFHTMLDTVEGQAYMQMVGLDAQALKKMDGVQAFFEAQKAARQWIKDFGGRDDISMDMYNKNLGSLSAFNSAELAGSQEYFQSSLKYYSELQAKDKRDDKALRDFDKASSELSDSWEIMVGTAMSQLAPILTSVAKGFKSLLDSITRWLNTKPLDGFFEAIKNFVISIKVWLADKFGLLSDDEDVIKYKASAEKEKMRYFGALQNTVNSLKISSSGEHLNNTRSQGYKKNFKDIEGGVNDQLDKVFKKNWATFEGSDRGNMEKQLTRMGEFFDEFLDKGSIQSLLDQIMSARQSAGNHLLISFDKRGNDLVFSARDKRDSSLMIKETVIGKNLLGK